MEPTCVDTIVHTVPEAHTLMYAVLRAMRPLIHRRPCNDDERAMIRPGAVFVWEEGSGIERWTDRREWGDSRSREDFLFYTEGPKASTRSSGDTLPSPTIPKEEPLVKQTYTALVDRGEGLRKWHLIAYFKESTKHELRPVSHDPELACLEVPPDTFKQARLPKSRRARDRAWSGPGAPFQSLRPSTSGGKDVSGGSGGGSGAHRMGDRDMMLKPVDTALRPYRLSASTTVRSNWSNSSDGGRYAGDQNQNAWPGYRQQTRSPHQVDEYHHAYHEPETPTRYHMPVLEKEKRSPGSHSPTLVDEHPYVLTPFHELRPLRELLVTMGLGSADGQARRSSPLDHGTTPPIALALHEVRPIREASDPVGTIHTSDERVRRRTPLDEQVLQRLFVQSVA